MSSLSPAQHPRALIIDGYRVSAFGFPRDDAARGVIESRRALAVGRGPADDPAKAVVERLLRRCRAGHCRERQQCQQHLRHGACHPMIVAELTPRSRARLCVFLGWPLPDTGRGKGAAIEQHRIRKIGQYR
jgi:hypothetical protein